MSIFNFQFFRQRRISLWLTIFKQISNYKFQITKLSFVLFIAFTASFTTCYLATPTVFGGRDQGAIATAAINLAKYKSFTYKTPVSEDLFQKYGPGKALNYPGFDYTKDGKMISRFPIGYTSYLAGAYALFGLKGIQFANFLPLFLFFILFWLTLRQFFSEKISFLGFLLAATFFPFLWFAKYTLTEIFTLFLIWTGIYFLLKFQGSTLKSEKVEPFYLYISLAVFGLSALARIEGIVFYLLAVIYSLFLLSSRALRLCSGQTPSRDLRALANSKPLPANADSSPRSDATSELSRNDKMKTLLIIFTLFLLILYGSLNFPALLDSAKNIAKVFLPNSTKDSAPSINLYSHLARVFFNYNILIYLILGLVGIGWLVKNAKQNWTKPQFLVIFILFPSFFYLISPLVSLDDPWLFRRYVFAVFPALIFYSIYFLNRYNKNKMLINAIFAALIISNLLITSQYVTYSENKNLLPQVESLSKKFGDNDLILVDRLASGSGWSLISEPLSALYNKQAVYFFNAEDLKHIKKDNYKNIYLIAPLDGKQTWHNNLNKELVSLILISNNYLKESSRFFSLSQNVDATTTNGIWKIR